MAGSVSQKPRGGLNYGHALIVRMAMAAVGMAAERAVFVQKSKDDGSFLRNTVDLASDTISKPSLAGLMREMFKQLVAFTGFKEANVMFHDEGRNLLYTITYGDDDEHRAEFEYKLSKATTPQERQYILDKESMHDFTVGGSRMINYPVNVGLTGQVFETQKTILINDFGKSFFPGFQNEIDNAKGLKDIKNMMIGAMKREDGTTCGII